MLKVGTLKTKQELRQFYKEQMVKAENTSVPQHQLHQNLVQFLKNKTGTWAAFKPIGHEPQVQPALDQSSCDWVYPRVNGETITFYRPKTKESFVKGPFDILEPDLNASTEVALSEIEGVLVPGLAFDLKGGRLGRGKAFYDKTLQQYRGEKVGVAFSYQVDENELPMEPWDIYMSALVTENQTYQFKR